MTLKDNPFMNTALLVDDVISSRVVEHSRLLSLGIDALAVNNVQEAFEILMADVLFDTFSNISLLLDKFHVGP